MLLTEDDKKRLLFERVKAIFEAVTATAEGITSELKKLPRTGKQGRNIFIKTYNRKPGNKKKRAIIFAQTAVKTYMGAVSTAIILSQSVPKFKNGS